MLWFLLLAACTPDPADPDDLDGDGVVAALDCDDEDAAVGAADTLRFADCDGDGVAGASSATTCAEPDPAILAALCGASPTAAWTPASAGAPDCDDTHAAYSASVPWYPDCDGDGRFEDAATLACGTPELGCDGAAPVGGWTDTVPTEFDCDGTRQDLDAVTDWWRDCDGDGAFHPDPTAGCGEPVASPCAEGAAPAGGWADAAPETPDCDDEDPDAWPGGADTLLDGIDGDCDGTGLPAPGPDDVYVSLTGSERGTGTRSDPNPDLHAALAAVGDDGVIRVAAGTYTGPFAVGATVIGGYSADGSWAWDPDAYPTTLTAPAGPPVTVAVSEVRRALVGLTVEAQGDAPALSAPGSIPAPNALDLYRVTTSGPSRLDNLVGTFLDCTFYAPGSATALELRGQPTDLRVERATLRGEVAGDGTGLSVDALADVTLVDSDVFEVDVGVAGRGGILRVVHSRIEAEVAGADVAADGVIVIVGSDLYGRRHAGLAHDRGRLDLHASDVSAGDGGVDSSTSKALLARSDATLRVSNSLVHGGVGAVLAFGVEADDASVTLINNHLYGGDSQTSVAINVAPFDGGTVTAANNVIVGGAGTPRALIVGLNGGVILQNNLFVTTPYVQVQAGTSFTDIAGVNDCTRWAFGCLVSLGNLAGDPLYDDAYLAQPGSPTINAGTPGTSFWSDPEVAIDYYGTARPAGARWDIGPTEQ